MDARVEPLGLQVRGKWLKDSCSELDKLSGASRLSYASTKSRG